MSRIVALITALALSSCGVIPGVLSEKEFSRKYAEELCDRSFDCDETTSEAFWGSEDACTKETQKELTDSYDNECAYDAKAARECLKSFRELSCNPHYEIIQTHVALCDTIFAC